ncbi:MAG TPA: hypothetical protein VMM54_11145 [Nitrospirota bacterium]|nr:hypothetical protein [Nitrospirota bacterium]
MASNLNPVFPCHIVLECFTEIILAFDCLAASGANHLVTTEVRVHLLFAGDVILKPTLLIEAGSSL